MKYPGASRALRLAAGVMALMLLLIALFPAFYVAAEADHACSGEDCPICACIRQCENTLRCVGEKASACSAAIPAVLILLAAAFAAAAVSQDTLISGKVRLNN